MVSAGAAITLLGTFLTWLRSGSADRSSYAVFGLVDRLGFSEGGVVGWALQFRREAQAAGLATGRDDAQFLRWFDLMGVQRHLKVGGIFARLWHRDGKPGYLADIPRTLEYAVGSCARHEDFRELGELIARRVLPAVVARLTTTATTS